MKNLSPLAQELVKAGRDVHAPSAADKQRVHQALQHKLAAPPQQEPALDPAPLPKPAPTPAAPWPLLSAVAVGAGLLAGALYWGLAADGSAPGETPRAPPSSLPPPPPVPPAPASASPPRTRGDTRSAKPLPAPVPESTERRPSASRGQIREGSEPKQQLAEEVALLSKATSALHAGRAQRALTLLAEHQRKFPRGALSVERRAARAQALCQLGRRAEAERELARLPPNSPQAARAKELCGLDRR